MLSVNMNNPIFINAFSQMLNNAKDEELSKNEKLFLASVGLSKYYVIDNNKIDFSDLKDWHDSVNSYFTYNIKSLNEIYTILGDKISVNKILNDVIEGKIDKFDFIKDSLKIFFNEYLTESEQSHLIALLNEVPKGFLHNSYNLDDLFSNMDNLLDFFHIMYYITDKKFKYNKKVVYGLLNTNKYTRHKAFFNTLTKKLTYEKKFRTNEVELAFCENIEKLLSNISDDFNESMAKSLIE